MCNLFVIGNGFDLAHDMKTDFNHFRDYLNAKYLGKYKNMLYVPESVINNHGEEIQNDDEVISLITYLLNKEASYDTTQQYDWNRLEDIHGKIDLFECLDNVEPQYDKEGDRNYSWEYDNAESVCRNVALSIKSINKFLSEWIHTIKIADSPIEQFKKIINPEKDLFFTFNYTQTLEKLYRCSKKNVCHIHGMVSDPPYFQTEELILGHCGQIDYLGNESIPYNMNKNLQIIYESLRKNIDEQIFLHKDFFKEISNTPIWGIYSFGFSFSDVDLPYIRKICDSLNTKNIVWWLNEDDSISKREEYKKIRIKCGVEGDFFTYNVS